jgi:two-component system sporulation sensor kinase A
VSTSGLRARVSALFDSAARSIAGSPGRARRELDERRHAEAVLQRRVRELTLLGSVATIAAEESDEERLIARATAVVRDTLFPDNCGIMLCDHDAGLLRYTASFHARSTRAASEPRRLGVGIVGQVAETGVPRRVPDTTQAPDYIPLEPGMLSEMCVPLKVGERVLGVFDVESSRRDAFSDDDERVLFTLACLLASAIERIRASAGVRASEERFRALVQSAWDVITIHDAQRRLVYASPALTRVLGYSDREWLGRDTAELVHPDDLERNEAAVAQVLDKPNVEVSHELRARRKDGTWAWLEAVACNLLHVPAVRGIVLTIRDVTERHHAEQALRESEERWRRISEASLEGIAFSEKGVLVDANEQFALILGYGLPELIGKPVIELVAPEHRALVEARIRAGSTLGYAHLAQRKDGAIIPVETRARLLTIEGRTLRVTAVRDMSERARLEGELEKHKRLAAVGELVAGVAHEVRTPLFAITANLDVYETQPGTPEDKHHLLATLRAHVQRLSSLMSDLLDYGRPPALRFSRGGLEPIVARAVRSCTPQALQAGVTIREEYGAGVDGLDRDPERLEQVFQNLLSNALHFSPRGGTVRVSLFRSSEPPGVTIAVEDEGPGLPAGDAAQVFQPFFSRRKGGTGLGLAIVQRIVEQHGGSVRADARAGGGSIFTVFLPAPEAQAA